MHDSTSSQDPFPEPPCLARQTWSPAQALLAAGVVAICIAACWIYPARGLAMLNVIMATTFAVIVLFKTIAVLAGLLAHDTEAVHPAELRALRGDSLPIYSLLVPLYHESAVIPELLAALSAMDYPTDKLDIQLLVEHDDPETAEAIMDVDLPPHMEMIIVPPGEPRTKPRACNVGLAEARGEFVVIFDAEDRPEPDQLKKAVTVFRRMPEKVVCLQAHLNFYNARQNQLTRWFTLEYSTWFDLYLPGLHTLHAPIPLGGTSNHFRTAALRAIGGWDAWNVTEDCDLGIRIARAGTDTRIMDSTTWEEAVSQLRPWVAQRSRWVKGYWQTLLVHTRTPLQTLRDLGPWRALHLLLVVGGQVFSLVLTPLCWALLLAWSFFRWPIFDPQEPFTVWVFMAAVLLLLANALFIAMHAVAAVQRKLWGFVKDALGLPVYWLLMSLGAWKGVTQYIRAPFKWEKTPHGAPSPGKSLTPSAAPTPQPSRGRRFGSAVVLAATTAALIGIAFRMPVWLDFTPRIQMASISLDEPVAQSEIGVHENWSGRDHVLISLTLDPPPAPEALHKAIVHVKVSDGEWYQLAVTPETRVDARMLLRASFGERWTPRGTRRPWGPWCLRRIRAIGVRVYSDDKTDAAIAMLTARADGNATPKELAASVFAAPDTLEQYQVGELRLELSRHYDNPFDPREIEVAAVISAPDGSEQRIPAFYLQDYQRRSSRRPDEILTAHGSPCWAVRYAPRAAGTYTWYIEANDHLGATTRTEGRTITVAASSHPGYVRVDPEDPRFFSFENGDFFYPIAINLRSPHDDRQPSDFDYAVPADTAGLAPIERYLDTMAAGGMTMARIWMTPWFAGIEWHADRPGYHGLGRYNLQNAWRIDGLLDAAAERGIHIEVVIQNHGAFATRYDSDWPDNPYNVQNGGPNRHNWEIFTNPQAQEWFAQRLRYLGARYGAHPALFGWTMWTEIDAIIGNRRIVERWHRDMIPVLRKADTGGHMISTEFMSPVGMDNVWRMPEIDYTQVAAYSYGEGVVQRFREAAGWLSRYDKPAILEEYAGPAMGGEMRPLAQQVHDGLWAAWMQPLAASPMAWWWNFIFERDLTRFHLALSRFAAGEDLRGENWRYEVSPVAGKGQLSALLRRSKTRAYAWIHRPASQGLTYPRDDTVSWEDHPSLFNSAYRRTTGDRFDPLSDTAPTRFDPISDAALELRNMAPGTYDVEIWETWGTQQVDHLRIKSTHSTVHIELPPLARDIALKLRRIEPAQANPTP